ncbi:hypothetical protein ACIPDS_18390 [Kluyvera sp. NPDC087067]|uniref:hypothetical protein n=1 Tax=Kluyvera sp. NPDC087067 TaxID=3364105 RepID=UPI00382F0C0C
MALLIGSVRFPGTWTCDMSAILTDVRWFVARQLGISGTLVTVEHHSRWFTSGFPRHFQRFDD